MTNEIKLRECPFCGGEAEKEPSVQEGTQIWCKQCHSRSPWEDPIYCGDKEAEKAAIEAWNKRRQINGIRAWQNMATGQIYSTYHESPAYAELEEVLITPISNEIQPSLAEKPESTPPTNKESLTVPVAAENQRGEVESVQDNLENIKDDPKLKGVLKLMIKTIENQDSEGYFKYFDVLLKMTKLAIQQTDPAAMKSQGEQ